MRPTTDREWEIFAAGADQASRDCRHAVRQKLADLMRITDDRQFRVAIEGYIDSLEA